MKGILWISRWIVGALFIFSGLIKANDPLGLSYKMQEFFEVWGWHNLNDFTLTLSILMIAFEIIAGVAVISGWKFNLFSWLLLILILFFTFLTGYALLSGEIRECGCFGDCIKLTAKESFIKDLILLAFILFLFFKRNAVQPFFKKFPSLLLLGAVTAFSFGIQFYVLKHLPVVDCLPYKVGNNIVQNMKIPAGAIPDSTVINYVYTKQGKEVEFDADHFPADFDDSIYTFVKRYDKVVRKGNAQPLIKDFVIVSLSGTDTTMAILEQPGKTIVIFAKSLPSYKKWDWGGELKKIIPLAKAKNIPVIMVSADADNAARGLAAWEMPEVHLMKGDLVAIKTAARADPTMYILDQGTIKGKWSYANFADAIPMITGE